MSKNENTARQRNNIGSDLINLRIENIVPKVALLVGFQLDNYISHRFLELCIKATRKLLQFSNCFENANDSPAPSFSQISTRYNF